MPNQKLVIDQDLLSFLVIGFSRLALQYLIPKLTAIRTNERASNIIIDVLLYVALPGFG
jgi:hypothetical protein